MGEIFNVKVNNLDEFKISDKDLIKLDLVENADYKYHILQNNKPYKAEISTSDFNQKSYQVKVNNNTYNVRISDALDMLINDMGFTIGSSKTMSSVKAPMPGLILDINVTIGQEINEDAPLLILEAMKMENIICSPRKGVIKSISVNKGDAVEKNQLLIEFE